jgi:hypothetical protein
MGCSRPGLDGEHQAGAGAMEEPAAPGYRRTGGVEEPAVLGCMRRAGGVGLTGVNGSRRWSGGVGLTGSNRSGPAAWRRSGPRTGRRCSQAGAVAGSLRVGVAAHSSRAGGRAVLFSGMKLPGGARRSPRSR